VQVISGWLDSGRITGNPEVENDRVQAWTTLPAFPTCDLYL